jgi:glycosyltransferase involved in cell wall biosynthesis
MFHADVAARLALAGRRDPPLVSSVQAPQYEPEVRKAAGWPAHAVALRRFVDASTARLTPTTFVACSRTVARSCGRRLHVAPRRVRVIHNAVEYADLAAEGNGRALRSELGLVSGALLIGNVGRLDPQKGQLGLIDAFAIVAQRVGDAHLVIVGTGPLHSALRERTAALGLSGRVHLLGERTDVGAILHALDLFVFPSLFEGLPLAVIEAMAVGVPVIASSLDPLRELISDGITGVLVGRQDTEGLATAVAELADDELARERLGEAGRDHARRHFSVETTSREWTKLYEQVARGRSE